MENSGERRESVCSRSLHFAHDIHHNGACLTDRELYLTVAVTAAEGGTETCIRLLDSESTHLNRTESFDGDATIGRHCTLFRLLRSAVNIDEHGIAGTQTVVLRGGNVHVRFEREFVVIEDIASEHFLFQRITLGKELLKHLRRIGNQLEKFVLIVHEFLIVLIVSVLVCAVALGSHAHIAVSVGLCVDLPAIVGTLVVGACLAVVSTQTRIGIAAGLV